MNSPAPFFSSATEPRLRRARDITWGRILFQPPALLNPRQVFDPLPFRTQNVPRLARSRGPFAR
jgi:hypothetical protein